MSGGIQKLTKFLSKFEEYFIAFLMAAMTAVNFANVFVRYVLKSNIPWALEFTVISFAWIIFLGAAWGIKAGAHIGIDTVLNLFSDKNKRIISTFAAILCIAYCIFIIIGSYNYVHKIYSVGILSQDIRWLPQWVPRMVMPVSYGLMIYRFTEALWKILKGQKVNLGLADEAKDAIETFNLPERNKNK
jgi:C4-dicarboxylate transporter, DctQ subunit